MKPEIAVLASGTGTLFRAIVEYGEKTGRYRVTRLIVDRMCPAIDIARELRIPNIWIRRDMRGICFTTEERGLFTQKVCDELKHLNVSLVVIAGFMTILSPSIFETFGGRILNTHPSLLPAFKGAHAVRDFLASNQEVTGCTVHIATKELDAGEILAQAQVERRRNETEESLHERIKQAERILYPETIVQYLDHLKNENPRPS